MGEATAPGGEGNGDVHSPLDPSGDLLAALLDALRHDDEAAMRALAGLAVDRFGGLEAQPEASERYYLYRILRQVELYRLLAMALGDSEGPDPAARHGREELARRIEDFRRLLATQLRHRMAASVGPEQLAELYRERRLEDVDFLGANAGQLRELRQAVRPLARKLAARAAPEAPAAAPRPPGRPPHRAPLAVLGRGPGRPGVPGRARLQARPVRAGRRLRLGDRVRQVHPVAAARHEPGVRQAPQLRLCRRDRRGHRPARRGRPPHGPARRLRQGQAGGRRRPLPLRQRVPALRRALRRRHRRPQHRHRQGDARNNYREPGLAAFQELARALPPLYWLNPEPRDDWDTTDSIISAYGPACDRVFEVRTLRQLTACVDEIT